MFVEKVLKRLFPQDPRGRERGAPLPAASETPPQKERCRRVAPLAGEGLVGDGEPQTHTWLPHGCLSASWWDGQDRGQPRGRDGGWRLGPHPSKEVPVGAAPCPRKLTGHAHGGQPSAPEEEPTLLASRGERGMSVGARAWAWSARSWVLSHTSEGSLGAPEAGVGVGPSDLERGRTESLLDMPRHVGTAALSPEDCVRPRFP